MVRDRRSGRRPQRCVSPWCWPHGRTWHTHAGGRGPAKWWCRHRCHPPLLGQQAGRTFVSIFKAEARKRLTEPADTPSTSGLVVRDMQEFATLALPPRCHVLKPVLPEKGLAMLFAPRGVGKTYVALAMAYAIATAGRFLRWSAPACRSVLYVDGEMPA